MVANIMRDNSQNTVQAAPQLSAWISSIEMDPERRRDPSFVRKVRAVERAYDPDVDAYSTVSGNRFSVESYMPVPYNLTMQLDLWTTNTTDKFQVFEQIATVFNPSVQIQSNDNPLDWTSIYEVEMTSINWSSRGVPAGIDSQNDIASLTFKLPVWITPPGKVTRQRVIETIVTNLYDGSVEEAELRGTLDYLSTCFEKIREYVVTPANLQIEVLPESDTVSRIRSMNPEITWESLFPLKGNVEVNGGKVTLNPTDDIENIDDTIVGTVTKQGSDLLFTVNQDTLPPTLYTVTAIIDPVVTWPGRGLSSPVAGQRYLLIDESRRGRPGQNLIPEELAGPWNNAQAQEFDIIEFDGAEWRIIFDASAESDTVYIRNDNDGQHYQFNGNGWEYTYLGVYEPGYWSIEV